MYLFHRLFFAIAIFLGGITHSICDTNVVTVTQAVTVTTAVYQPSHATPIEKDALFNKVYKESVNSSVEYTYWFSAKGSFKNDVTINVHTVVGENVTADNPVRFEVQWVEFVEQASTVWLLPKDDIYSNGTVIPYYASNQTLCSDINDNPEEVINKTVTVKVTVSTLSISPVSFSLTVVNGTSNVISNLNETTEVDLTLFSPVYFKLKINDSAYMSRFALLEVSSTDDLCATVALQPPQCPLLDQEKSAELGRHLTMSKSASVTIKMSYLKEGRFLIFVLHKNDSKCRSDECEDCWKNEIVPLGNNEQVIRKKHLVFTLREKITNDQYIFSTLLCSGLFFLMFLIFPIIYCTCRYIHIRRRERAESITQPNANGGGNSTSNCNDTEAEVGTSDRVRLIINADGTRDEQPCEVYLCGVFEKRYDDACCTVRQRTPEARRRSAQRYFGTLVVNAIFYILPAVQLIWIYQRVFKYTGNEDICYFNFRCLHPLFGLTAFNHVFSNVGYVILGGLFYVLVRCEKSSQTSGIFKAMGIALMIQGVMSGLYHTCPNHISFQFDTCFMYITSILCWVNIYQRQHPETTASAIMSYSVVAVAVVLGVAAVLSQVWYFWFCITAVHLLICFVVSLHLDSMYGKYQWTFVRPWTKSCGEILYSFVCQPFLPDSFTLTKIALIMFNFINVLAAVFGHWMFHKSQDFASYLLFLFILNLFLFSSAYLWMKAKERNVPWQTWFFLLATIPTWMVALYYYFRVSASWGVSPAESRTLNTDCILVEFFDGHDVWHFVSAFGMFLNFMFFFTLDEDEDTTQTCPPVENTETQT